MDQSDKMVNQLQETMSSSWATVSEEDSDIDSDDDSFKERCKAILGVPMEKDPRWADLFDEDEWEDKPRISIDERDRLRVEKEKELYRIARARQPIKIPDDYVPEIQPTPREIEEAKAERYKEWLEKQKRIKREKAERQEAMRKIKRAEYEKYAKLQKEYYTRDYYWKPDPLFTLHLKLLGYSKIAIDKALFYTDNHSVSRAVAYLKDNPNPTELTKEEVMAVGEEVLKKIRPARPEIDENSEQSLPRDGEMEIEEASQGLLSDDGSSTDPFIPDDCFNKNLIQAGQILGEEKSNLPKDVEIARGESPLSSSWEARRGIKRTHSGDEVKSVTPESTVIAPELPTVKKEPLEYKMIFIVNVSLLMDAITLSLEVGKVVARLTNKVKDSEEGGKKLDEWSKYGCKMAMYKGRDSEQLSCIHENHSKTSEGRVLTYLGRCSHYREVKTPSSTVLGLFGDSDRLRVFCNSYPML